jgi:hypothetical protein
LSAIGGKIEQHVCIKFCVKLSKSTTEILEMLCVAFGEHSLSWTAVFEWHSSFKAGRVSVEDDKRSGQPTTNKMTENVDKFENSSRKTVAEKFMSTHTLLGSVMEFARNLSRKFEHAPHCHKVCSPTLDFVTNNNIVIVPHPPYSPVYVSSLFPKLKMKLKGRRFETVSDIQRESQAVLDSIKANDLHIGFESWKT